ncbi:hypothetical protein ES703_87243 [subsurface metagenome]
MAQLIYLFIYICFLLNIGIGAGDIGFRLVVIVIADEVFYGVVGEELLKLGAELGSQCLVVADKQGRLVYPGNNISHGKSLAAAGNPEQCLVLVAFIQAISQLIHRLGLVTGHPKI